MSAAWPLFVGLLLGQAPADKPLDPDATLDVSTVDQIPKSETERLEDRRSEFESLTSRSATHEVEIVLEPGASAEIGLEVPLSRASVGPLALRIPSSRKGQLELGPLLSMLDTESRNTTSAGPSATKKRKKQKKKRRAPTADSASVVATGRYFVRSRGAKTGLVREGTNAEVIELASGAVLAKIRLEPKIRIEPPTSDPSTVQSLEKAAEYFSAKRDEAELALQQATKTKTPLAAELLQPGRIDVAAFELIVRTLELAWRHEVALARLRFATRSTNNEAALSAMIATGRLVPRADLSRAQSRGAPGDELVRVKQHLNDLELDRAELLIAGLRRRGDLTRTELGDLLAFDGAVSAVRGQREAAEKLMGRALCLEPARETPDSRPPIRGIFDAVKAAELCTKPLRANVPEAFITTAGGKTELQVRVSVGPDPYGVIAGGSIMLFGSGGGVIAERKVRAEGEGERILLASFPDDDELRNIEGALLVQVAAKDVSGVVLAAVGDPVPVRVEVGEHEDYSESLPWWVWVGGGLLIVAGAGVAAIALVPREDVRGIGPFDIRF